MERLEAAEAEAREVDRKEAAFQKEQRRLAIERANRILYEDSEPVRRLRGGLLLARVTKEREAQVARKKKREELLARQEEIFQRQVLSAAEKMRLREEAEAAERKRVEDEARRGQLEQRELVRQRKEREKAEDMAEGKRLAEAARQREREAAEKAVAEAARKKAATAEFLALNNKLQRGRALQRQAEEEEEARLAAFAAEKDRRYHEKREKEAELFKSRMNTRGKLIEAQMKLMADRLAKEETSLQNEQAARNERMRARDEGDKERNKTLVGEVLSDWDARRQRKREAAEQQLREERELQARWDAHSKRKDEEEAAARERKRTEAKQLQEFLRLQMKAKRLEEEEHARLERELVVTVASAGAQRKRFEEYAATALEESGIDGDAKPVRLAIQKLERTNAFE